jgi:hypothetical protein
MDLPDTIATYLKASVAALQKVSGAADFASAGIDLKGKLPVAYVLLLSDRAGSNQLINAVEQHVEVRFGVVLAVQNLRDAIGKNAHSDLDPIIQSVIAALLGWQPDTDHDPVLYSSGRLLQLADSVLWWQLEFTTAYYLRKV